MIRTAAVAGKFYPGSATALRRQVEGYLSESGVTPAPDRVAALIAPHAGYPYSGPAAAHAYARARGKTGRVVLLGRSHHYRFSGAAVLTEGACETPLGRLRIDEPLAKALLGEGVEEAAEPHLLEHSLEVQFPFLQVALGDSPIVPVLFGSAPSPWHEQFGLRLASLLTPDDLLVASTDLSHFLSEEEANEIDRRSLDRVLSRDYQALADEDKRGTCSMCGATAVYAAMVYALTQDADDWQLLDYRTSAAASGDYSRVVGYGAISMERSRPG